MQLRALSVLPESWDASARTVDVVWSTGARVARFEWGQMGVVDEELDMAPGAVDLSRLNAGAPVLDSHQAYELRNIIGTVVPGSARVEDGKGIAQLRLSGREDVSGLVEDISAGIIRNISIGYTVDQYEIEKRPGQRDLFIARAWQPHEISFVPVPADAAAQARGHDAGQGGFPCTIRRAVDAPAFQEAQMSNEPLAGQEAPAEDTPVTETRTAAPAPVSRVRSDRVREVARIAGFSADETTDLLARHADAPFTEEALSREAIRVMAERAPAPRVGGATVVVDEREKVRAGISAALAHRVRATDRLTDGAENWRGMSLLDMARDVLERDGVRTRGLVPMEVARLVLSRSGTHHTGDFPLILANTANKSLRRAYDLEPRAFLPFCRVETLRDFKTVSRIQLGDAPELLETNEAGEILFGTMGEQAESYALKSWARAISFTQQMLINDDLSAFNRVAASFGARAAHRESRLVFTDILMGNPNMADGGALFQTSVPNRGGNLTSTGTAISVTSLGIGRAVLQKQKTDGGMEMDLKARFLICGPDKLTEAEQHTSQILPNAAGSVNPFVEFRVISTGLVTGNTWFLAAAPDRIDTIEVGYLEGMEGPMVEESAEFDTWGVKMRCIHVVNAKAIDYRGLYRNNGA